MRKVGGDKAADGFCAAGRERAAEDDPGRADRDRRIAQPNFWNREANTLDRATAMMPKLLYERLDEIGTDFAVIYPTAGLGLLIKDDATRRAVIRAYKHPLPPIISAYYSDCMTPAAIIPMIRRRKRSKSSNSSPSSSARRSQCSAATCRGRFPPLRPRMTSHAALHGVVRRAWRIRQPL